ncbi:Protein transport protein SEC9 [Ceratobasidium theobromae]|uniref:Protein transport protein SEC9 n=1 Tax=Ceratobasidium theobromae TaxID=1582974 RepID=A0A5N5QUF8_9AGAM|nr:Protein transport protein SEC9 [Ceratobasidium theobromae]
MPSLFNRRISPIPSPNGGSGHGHSNAPPIPDQHQHYFQNDRYARNAGIGDRYSRGYGNVDQDRAELFAGHRPHDQADMTAEEEEEEIQTVKQDTKRLKEESVQSTRGALRIAHEAEEPARNVLLKLVDQSEKIANVERHFDRAKGSANRAQDKTDENEQLNRSIFRPTFAFSKQAKRLKEERRIADGHEHHDKVAFDVCATRSHIGMADANGKQPFRETEYLHGEGGGAQGGQSSTPEQQRACRAARAKYQFEATASDDDLEDELDDNLDEIHGVVRGLKGFAEVLGQELDGQNPRLQRISNNADRLDSDIERTTGRLGRIK